MLLNPHQVVLLPGALVRVYGANTAAEAPLVSFQVRPFHAQRTFIVVHFEVPQSVSYECSQECVK